MATKQLEVYKCDTCGNIVEIIGAGAGTIKCCGGAMALITENTVDAAKEKHVPVAESAGGSVTVKVGDVAHPMEEKHYIEWIQIIADGKSCRTFLKAGDAPEAVFKTDASDITVRAYCNLHGLWKA